MALHCSVPGSNRCRQGQCKFTEVDHFGIDDGLSQGSIRALFQSSRSYIWIGTESAINRVNPDTLALEQLFITSIVDDHRGSLWFAHWYYRLMRYDKATEQFTFCSDENSNLSSYALSSLWLDRQNTLWLVGNAGLSSYRPGTVAKFADGRLAFGGGQLI